MSSLVRKLFVRNLPWTIGNKQLEEYFTTFGHVRSAAVVFDKNSGISRGYGFVIFSFDEGVEKVFNHKVHSLEGRVLTIEETRSAS